MILGFFNILLWIIAIVCAGAILPSEGEADQMRTDHFIIIVIVAIFLACIWIFYIGNTLASA